MLARLNIGEHQIITSSNKVIYLRLISLHKYKKSLKTFSLIT